MGIIDCAQSSSFLNVDHFIAGWVAGVMGLLAGHPFDTIKVRQQIFQESFLKTARKTFIDEGIRGFYKGLLFPLLTIGFSNAIFFGTYGSVLEFYIPNNEQRIDRAQPGHRWAIYKYHTIAGLYAGLAQVLFTCPVDAVKTILQSSSLNGKVGSSYKGPSETFITLLKTRGIRGIYKGFLIMLIRDVPTSPLYVVAYEDMMYFKFSEWNTHLFIKQMIAGGIAGCASYIPVVPADVVKSKLQSDSIYHPRYNGIRDCFKKTYLDGGIPSFYTGCLAVIIRAFVTNAVMFLCYEKTFGIIDSLPKFPN